MKKFFLKWLPICFGCHQKPERSFSYKGQSFPLCARCSGQLLGIILALFCYPFFEISLYLNILLLLPMIVDGFWQALSTYESTNVKRLITGSLFGYALINLLFASFVATFHFGYRLGLLYVQ